MRVGFFEKRGGSTKGYVSLDQLICFFAYFVLFGSRKKKVVDFYLPNSRFHQLLIVHFQEQAQDLTLIRRQLLYWLENLQISCRY